MDGNPREAEDTRRQDTVSRHGHGGGLPRDDLIHLSTEGQRRVGKRAAREMAYLCGYDAKPTPEILSISVEPDKVRYFWCCINVKYKNLDGDLTAYGDNPMGFSITSEDETPYLFPYRGISNVTLKGDTVSIRTELTAEQLKSVSLWYGAGLSCACTITDGGGMAIGVRTDKAVGVD